MRIHGHAARGRAVTARRRGPRARGRPRGGRRRVRAAAPGAAADCLRPHRLRPRPQRADHAHPGGEGGGAARCARPERPGGGAAHDHGGDRARPDRGRRDRNAGLRPRCRAVRRRGCPGELQVHLHHAGRRDLHALRRLGDRRAGHHDRAGGHAMRDLIRWLARRGSGRDERGVTGVLVAGLIGGGVLLGVGALVADAGALAVARTCVLATCDASTSGTGTAASFADGNASALTGGSATVDAVCGYDAQEPLALPACSPATGTTGSITDCPANPAGVNYVDVHTSTGSPGGLLPPVFARTLLGNQNYDGTRVFACAQVEWGASTQSNSLALTISYCDWQSLTGGKFDTLIPVYLKGKAKPCSGPAGSNLPGGFDWLRTTSSTVCTAVIDLSTDTTYNNTGNNVSAACKQALESYIDSYNAGKPVTVFIPIFDATSGQGSNATYTIMGLAGFVVTGYANLPGGGNLGPKSYGPANTLCLSSAPCVEGYFTPGIDPVGGIGPGPGFGAYTLKLTG